MHLTQVNTKGNYLKLVPGQGMLAWRGLGAVVEVSDELASELLEVRVAQHGKDGQLSGDHARFRVSTPADLTAAGLKPTPKVDIAPEPEKGEAPKGGKAKGPKGEPPDLASP